MQLQLVRYCYAPEHVQGILKYGENFSLSLWTLECPWMGNQCFVSCVPDGSYPLVKFDSPDHPECWVLTPVPGRTGILIHVGNHVKDTQGCILIGQSQEPGAVWNSHQALRQLNYTLDRSEQHVITLGSGLGAVLMPSTADPPMPSDSDGSNGNGGMSAGGTD